MLRRVLCGHGVVDVGRAFGVLLNRNRLKLRCDAVCAVASTQTVSQSGCAPASMLDVSRYSKYEDCKIHIRSRISNVKIYRRPKLPSTVPPATNDSLASGQMSRAHDDGVTLYRARSRAKRCRTQP
eukprot:2505099-Prymnesium_polylepis.1